VRGLVQEFFFHGTGREKGERNIASGGTPGARKAAGKGGKEKKKTRSKRACHPWGREKREGGKKKVGSPFPCDDRASSKHGAKRGRKKREKGLWFWIVRSRKARSRGKRGKEKKKKKRALP